LKCDDFKQKNLQESLDDGVLDFEVCERSF